MRRPLGYWWRLRVAKKKRRLTPENYVREWHRHGRKSDLRLPAWERVYQDRGLIAAAEHAGYITIGRDVAGTVTLLPKGEELLT